MMIPQKNDPRLAGEVERYHTWPTIGRETDATHQWNVARILLAIWPSAPRELIVEALFHDIGELVAGDMPSTIKDVNENISSVLTEVEQKCRADMSSWGIPGIQTFQEEWSLILKIVDKIDVWEFGLLEIEKGNRHGYAIAEDVVNKVDQILMLITDLVLINNCKKYIETRFDYHNGIMQYSPPSVENE